MKDDTRLLATLREMRSYPDGYPFRQATCKMLVAAGLARVKPGDNRLRPNYQITTDGIAAIESGVIESETMKWFKGITGELSPR